MKRYRNNVIVGLLFLIFGAILIAFSSIDLYRYRNLFKNIAYTNATVEDINYKTNVTLIKYNVDEQIYQNELNIIDTSFKVGDVIDIYYNRLSPNIAIVKSQVKFIFIYLILGILFIIIFIIIFLIIIILIRKDYKLKLNGKKIYANIDNIEINRSISRCPYKIECSYKVGKKVYKFINNSVWFDIKDIVKENNIKSVPVYVGSSYKDYYIDLSDLEKNSL